MKSIKFCKENAKKIEALLKEVNGKATAHTFNDFEEIQTAIQATVDTLTTDLGAKKYLPGAFFWVASGGKVASSYKNPRIVTLLCFVFENSGLFINKLNTRSVYPDYKTGVRDVLIKKEQREQIIKNTVDKKYVEYI